MSGDIEDFLKRAAQRRQARQGSQPPPPPPPRPRSEYSNARNERITRAQDEYEDDIEPALLEEPLAQRLAELKRKQLAAQTAQTAKRQGSAERRDQSPGRDQRGKAERATLKQSSAAKRAAASPKQASPPASVAAATAQAAAAPVATTPVEELMRLLQTPQGLRNAFLMREILDRPEHRW